MINFKENNLSLNAELQCFDIAWQSFIKEYKLEVILGSTTATTVSWKVADKAKLFENLQFIAEKTEQIHIGTVNNRYIASAVLHEPIDASLWIIKILERRAGSEDRLGLDSIDYLVSDLERTFTMLDNSGASVIRENNDMHNWLSLRFGANNEFEAKFTDHLVLAVARDELILAAEKILKQIRNK